MRLLLDTHTFLWFIEGSRLLSRTGRRLIEDPTNSPFLSIASLWEMAIKLSLGKLIIQQPFETLIPSQLHAAGVSVLPITFDHLVTLIALPFHHRDPFDRVLAAQATVEGVTIVSRDASFDAYPITRLW